MQPTGGNSAADFLSSKTRQLAEKRSELKTLEQLTFDQNLERQQGIFAQGPGTQLVEPNNIPKQPLPGPPGTVSQQSSNAPPQPGPAQTQANNDATQKNIPPNLGELEVAYLQARQQLVILNTKRDMLLKRLWPTAPAVREVTYEIATQENLLKGFKEQSEAQLKDRKYILGSEIKTLEEEVQEWETNALDASKKLSAFKALEENQRRLQTRHDEMQAHLQTLKVDKGIGQESVTVLEPATMAESIPPEKLKHLIMAGLTGLILGIGIVLFIDRLNDRPSSSSELEKLLPVPVLGQIPLLKAKNRRSEVPILQLDDDRYPLIEAYRSFRSALLYKDSAKDQPKEMSQSIVITSACPNDGKSMVSSNFAVTLAQAGARVLLIDADLRRGVLHKHFSVPASPGLAEVLSGQCDWTVAVAQTSIPNLDVLPCGASPRHSVNLFANPGKFLAEIRGHYDYYLFDTAPVMVGDDVLSLAPHVDGLIMVVRSGYTSGRIAQAALDLLRVRQVNVLGLVFNGVHPKSSDFYYYRYKEYYPQHPTA